MNCSPLIVRPKEEGRYELISGHRRKHAAELAGLKTAPVIVRDMSRDETVIAMVDSNLQREEILPSEKVFSYRMKRDAMKRQGQRGDLTSLPVAQRSRGKTSRELVAEQAGESQDQVRRYIRLTELIPDILAIVDEKGLGMRPAVALSRLPKKEQVALFETMECEMCVPSHAQAIKLRQFSTEGRLSVDVIASIMSEDKPNQVEQFKIPNSRISQFFKPGTCKEEKEAWIVKGLELLERQERKRDRER